MVGNDTLLDAIESHVTTQEIDDFLRADIVAKGLVDGMETFVVIFGCRGGKSGIFYHGAVENAAADRLAGISRCDRRMGNHSA